MPVDTLARSMRPVDLSNYTPVSTDSVAPGIPAQYQPGQNVALRSPVPGTMTSSVEALRQFNIAPARQQRVFLPNIQVANNAAASAQNQAAQALRTALVAQGK